jgi:hypothetical protein
LATNRRPTAGFRQFIEKCDAVTLPTTVAAAKPQAVSDHPCMKMTGVLGKVVSPLHDDLGHATGGENDLEADHPVQSG